MSKHNIAQKIYGAEEFADPGSAGTINVDRSPCIVPLTSAAAETRTLARPTKAGATAYLYLKSDGGDITLTVTGGYDESGNTTFTFSDAGQFAEFRSGYDGTNYFWRMTSNHASILGAGNGSLTIPATATPASVSGATGTAAPTLFTATGGVGGSTSIATTGTGGVGGGEARTMGAGGNANSAVTASTGGAGGASVLTAGAGGAAAVATVTSTGGAGGAITETSGAGGAVSAAVSGTATGGASGAVALRSGTGGAVTATTGTNVGGASGTASFGSGVGGAASGATDTGGASGAVTLTSGVGGSSDTGGASGAVTVGSGTGGVGTGTGGASGNTTVQTGAAGSGGAPTVGVIILAPGAVEKWRVTAAGVLNSLATIPANAATADGAVLATGGIAFTDVANAWIDDATQGTNTVTHYIGTHTIDVTAPSDRRLKKNIEPTRVEALPLILSLQMVDFDWKDPDADDRRQFGWIAQQVQEVLPHLVFADQSSNWTFYVKKHEIVTYLVKAMQEMAARLQVAEDRLARLAG